MTEMQKQAMDYCVAVYDASVIMGGDKDEDILGFICPECGEPIYFEDWDDNNTADWQMCPICETFFEDCQEE